LCAIAIFQFNIALIFNAADEGIPKDICSMFAVRKIFWSFFVRILVNELLFFVLVIVFIRDNDNILLLHNKYNNYL